MLFLVNYSGQRCGQPVRDPGRSNHRRRSTKTMYSKATISSGGQPIARRQCAGGTAAPTACDRLQPAKTYQRHGPTGTYITGKHEFMVMLDTPSGRNPVPSLSPGARACSGHGQSGGKFSQARCLFPAPPFRRAPIIALVSQTASLTPGFRGSQTPHPSLPAGGVGVSSDSPR